MNGTISSIIVQINSIARHGVNYDVIIQLDMKDMDEGGSQTMNNKIGVIVDSFRLGVREGLLKSKQVGAEGVQLYAVKGELDPANMTSQARKELRSFISSLGLDISAIVGDLGGHGFQDPAANVEKIEKSKRILDLAIDLGTNIVTTHIGIVPEDSNGHIYGFYGFNELDHEQLAEMAEKGDAFREVPLGEGSVN